MLPVHCPALLSESIESSLVTEFNHTKGHDVQQNTSYSSWVGIIPDPASNFFSSPFPLSKAVTFLLHLEDKYKPNKVLFKMCQQQWYKKLWQAGSAFF